jgi:hypothetical protein
MSRIRSPKSIAGFALVAAGSSILNANLASTLVSMHHILSAAGTINLIPALVLAVLQNSQAGGTTQHLVRALLQHTLLMFRPLLMVAAGTFLSRPSPTCPCKKFSDPVDFAHARSTLQ